MTKVDYPEHQKAKARCSTKSLADSRLLVEDCLHISPNWKDWDQATKIELGEPYVGDDVQMYVVREARAVPSQKLPSQEASRMAQDSLLLLTMLRYEGTGSESGLNRTHAHFVEFEQVVRCLMISCA